MRGRRTILMVEDEQSITEPLSEALAREGFDTEVTASATAAVELAGRIEPDLVLLDVMLPDGSGYDVCRELRAGSQVPIIMLTARGEEIDRVLGLELGADDYLTKPFSPRELLARVRAVLRRHALAGADKAAPDKTRSYRFAGWELNTGTRKLLSPKKEKVDLTNSEYTLLVALLRSPRQILSRDQLLDGTRVHADIFDRSIDVQVLRLRRKIEEDPNEPKLIRTERGVGYFLDADVTTT